VAAGAIFGEWTTRSDVIGYTDSVDCECSCGLKKQLKFRTLQSGNSYYCGKYSRHPERQTNATTHGESGHRELGIKETKEYGAWKHIKARCLNPKCRQYRYYGGAGVTICERWRDSPETFIKDVGRAPSPRHSIDRYPNPHGNYEPSNVRWATPDEQSRNKRNNLWIEFRGERRLVVDVSRQLGLDPVTVRFRLRRGASVEEALRLPNDTCDICGKQFHRTANRQERCKGECAKTHMRKKRRLRYLASIVEN
jgi:hypothetical protein